MSYGGPTTACHGHMQVVRGRDEGQNSPRWEIALVTVKKLVSWDGF